MARCLTAVNCVRRRFAQAGRKGDAPMPSSRRRLIQIAAAACALGLPAEAARAGVRVVRWRGVALGAEASITLYHGAPVKARSVLQRCATEIRRLEGIFSLYRPDSAICRLNRDGRLTRPPFELLDLTHQAAAVSRASDGAFDLTVQPLFALHARHFASPGHGPGGPDARALAATSRLVDHRLIDAEPRCVRFARPGMAITSNGIAQGYITDRIADLLAGEGLANVLVHLGEIRALGERQEGLPWRVGLAPGTIGLRDAALATSDPAGTIFGGHPAQHHLLDPRTGRPSQHARRVTVQAPTATLADALATARAIAPPELAARLEAAFPHALVIPSHA